MKLLTCLLILGLANGLLAASVREINKDKDVMIPESRIVGGYNAGWGQFPYQVLLRSNRGIFCGGSIISPNYILTAAHCVNDGSPAWDYHIRAGSVLFDEGGTVVDVAEIKIHPNYRDFDNDIALLRLSWSLGFNDNIRSIPLCTYDIPDGSALTITGWGGLYTGGPIPKNLQATTVYAMNYWQCQQMTGNIPAGVICFSHNQGTGACNGDSGGPAVHNGMLVGVADYVINGCGSSYPDGYAKVYDHIHWIRSNSDV